jgi:hypothetical protein
MTRESIIRERLATWTQQLQFFGYEIVGCERARGAFFLRGLRPTSYGVPSVTIDISEAWARGADPDRSGLVGHGCYLEAASWHAQIAEGDQGAERSDVDRSKGPRLIVHRHPFGEPNDTRTPLAGLILPTEWIRDVETIAARYAAQLEED